MDLLFKSVIMENASESLGEPVAIWIVGPNPGHSDLVNLGCGL